MRYAYPRISSNHEIWVDIMDADDRTFGRIIADGRKAKGWSLKELASRVKRVEGEEATISIQYLNDIEHERRGPSSDFMVTQFALALGLNVDWLLYRAGRWPEEFRDKLPQQRFHDAMISFRRTASQTK